jgi:2-methylisocitrate lyase-like PEP mutase family enzyme
VSADGWDFLMIDDNQHAKATTFRDLHHDGALVLPNAWDAGSAALIGCAGARAIATTSAGISWALARSDGQQVTREEMVSSVERIAAAVDLPVTADIEGGYGAEPDAVAATVRAIVEAGAVGINLEDSGAPDGGLFDPASQAKRIQAARAAADEAGLPELFINIRTDVYLFGIGEPEGRLDDVLSRAAAYAEAGSDGLFVPGLLDLDTLSTLADTVPEPVNAMVWYGAPDVAALRAAGVRRISIGQGIAQAAYSLARRAAHEVLTAGTYEELAKSDDFGAINNAVSAR